MNTLNNIVVGFGAMGTPVCLLLNLAGVIIGIVFVALPGLSSTMALVLFMPLTYSLKLYPAFALLLGLYIGSMSGSLISAILINIPSQPASIATTWDGAPMAKNGEAQKALGVAIVFSFLATILSIVVMMFIAPPLSKLALKFSAVEYFALGILSLTLVASLSGDNIFKGLTACLLGMAIGTIGLDPIDISLKPADVQEKVMDAVSTKKITKSLHVLPCGVQSMSLEIEGLVESSNTLAMIETAENQVYVLMTIPSAVTSRRYNILQQAYDLAELAGASVDTFADCPEWPYKPDSKLLATAQKAFYDKFGYEAGVEVSHSSLELGLFCKKISGLECISLGPKAYDVHTPAECLDWTTVQMVWDHIREILKDLND